MSSGMNSNAAAMPNRLAMDVRSSQDLREKFRQDPQGGLKAAAQQFEAMFMQMVMKSMRDAAPQDGLMNSEQSRFYTSMLDQQLALNMASGKGMGFARMIEQQLGRNLASSANAASMGAATSSSDPLSGAPVRSGQATANDLLPMLLNSGIPLQRGAWVGGRDASGDALQSQRLQPVGNEAGGGSGKAFVSQLWPHAVEASKQTGIPPQFLVAHAALESGWGKSEIKRGDGSTSYNLFGVKAGKSWSGATVDAVTTEYANGEAQKVTERFRAYGSYAEAFRDYASLLRNNSRFGGVIGSQDGTEFARRLQQAGYATDPMYADKLSKIINGPTLRLALVS